MDCLRRLKRLFGAMAMVAVSGCGDPVDTAFACKRDNDCVIFNMIGLLCLPDGRGSSYCAYRVTDCPTGIRWAESAAKDLRGRCVRPEMLGPDGGTDAPPPG